MKKICYLAVSARAITRNRKTYFFEIFLQLGVFGDLDEDLEGLRGEHEALGSEVFGRKVVELEDEGQQRSNLDDRT